MDFAKNQKMEDYSLRYTPPSFRTWSPWMVFLSCMVALSAMAGYALDATYVYRYGFANALSGFAIATVFTLPLTLVLAFYLARKHIDIDLLTRGSGFGYLGSTVTSLVYATYTLIFLAYEGAIMAQAVTALTHLELHASYALVALIMIPLTFYGMTFTTKFQAWTWPLWVVLIVIALVSAATAPHAFHSMVHLSIPGVPAVGFGLVAMFSLAAAQMSGAAQIGEQGDYLRFMPEPTDANRRSWRLAVIFGGPGLSMFFVVIFFASTLLVAFAGSRIGPAGAMVPVDLFTSVYQRAFGSHTAALWVAALLVILSQLKINIMNTYSGSLSWSNFFSRILHRHLGRATWVVLQCLLALVMMEFNIFNHIITALSLYANVAIAWIAAMVSDLIINKRWLKLAPPDVDFRRAHLFNLNPVGFGSMVIAGGVAIGVYYHALGPTSAQFSAFYALGIALVLPPVLAALTKGRWYVARRSVLPADATELLCARCEGTFDVNDMAACPFHGGAICSLCCSTNGACHDSCKPSPWRPTGEAPIVIDLADLVGSLPPRAAPVAAAEAGEGVFG